MNVKYSFSAVFFGTVIFLALGKLTTSSKKEASVNKSTKQISESSVGLRESSDVLTTYQNSGGEERSISARRIVTRYENNDTRWLKLERQRADVDSIASDLLLQGGTALSVAIADPESQYARLRDQASQLEMEFFFPELMQNFYK